MNKVEIIGNITRDVELLTSGKGTNYCIFNVAVNREFGNETDFISCKVWRDLAVDCAKVLKKGEKVKLIGSLNSSSYEKDGAKVYSMTVLVSDVQKFGKVQPGSGRTVGTVQVAEVEEN